MTWRAKPALWKKASRERFPYAPHVARFHRAWLVAAVTFLVLMTSAAFRSSVGVLVVPLEDEFGWSRSVTSIAVAVNLILYGLTAPFAAALMGRFGVRNIAAGALTLIAIGTGLTTVMTDPWHLVILWGVIVGLGVGAVALIFGSLVVNRWFDKRRGLMLGVMGAAWATGQLVFLPLIANVIDAAGWRTASWGIAIAALALIPIIWFVLVDRPSDVGLLPYGADPNNPPAEEHNTEGSAATAAKQPFARWLRLLATAPSGFWRGLSLSAAGRPTGSSPRTSSPPPMTKECTRPRLLACLRWWGSST